MSSATIRSLAVRASAALAVAALAACSTETTPTGPGVNLRGPAMDVVVGPGANASTAQIRLCKWSDATGTPYNFTITKVSGPGTLSLSGLQQITPTTPLIDGTGEYLPYKYEGCITILNDGAVGVTTVSITETVQNGVTLGVLTGSGNATTFVTSQPTATTTVGVSNVQAATVYFKNSGTPDVLLGCTYTQGYWKNHASGKKLDPTWNLLANGGNTKFFNGTANAAGNGFFGTAAMDTWLEVFNTPVKGDRRIALAYQFMAAFLNSKNGASLPAGAVATAFSGASAYFLGGSATNAQIDSWQGTLGSYNEGKAGIAHCGDE